MNLMTSEIVSPPQPTATHAEAISYAVSECALGQVLVARSMTGVCAILISADREELEADLAARFPEAILAMNEAVVRDDLAKVLRFMDRPAVGLDLPLDIRGTPFQHRVWDALRAVPLGTTVTYSDLARRLDAPASARAIAGACAANPIALAVPCHRVVRSNGDLAGYRWGIERKRRLIEKEAMV